MQLLKDVKRIKRVGKRVWRGRRAFMRLQKILNATEPYQENSFRVAVYFADSDVNIYQMRQWYAPLRELNKTTPIVILARNALAAEVLLRESELAVAYVPRVTSIENFLQTQELDLVFYVNQNAKNFQMLRYSQMWHVFINHGESDKIYMVSNQHKCYDYAFVAGDAAQERLTKTLWNYDVGSRTFKIGRPQADHFAGSAPFPADQRTTVLYAPTWEGDRPTAEYGSIASHGVRLVEKLIATRKHRIIYRPHPRSGVLNSEYAAADQKIQMLLAKANAQESDAHHIYDTSGILGWQLAATDIAICDISAMIYDRLATGKPLFVTYPVAAEAEVDTTGYLQACEWLHTQEVENIVEKIETLLNDPEAKARNQKWSQHYFGDTTPGEPTKRFTAAVMQLLDRAATERKNKAN